MIYTFSLGDAACYSSIDGQRLQDLRQPKKEQCFFSLEADCPLQKKRKRETKGVSRVHLEKGDQYFFDSGNKDEKRERR